MPEVMNFLRAVLSADAGLHVCLLYNKLSICRSPLPITVLKSCLCVTITELHTSVLALQVKTWLGGQVLSLEVQFLGNGGQVLDLEGQIFGLG